MPGPMSAPNGDRSLTVGTPYACGIHGKDMSKCSRAKAQAEASGTAVICYNVSKREFLNRTNRLYTGKSSVSH